MEFGPVNNALTEKREQLRRAVDRDRAQLRLAMQNLNTVVRERTDFRQHVARYPYHWLAGGFFVGFIWGMRAVSKH